MKKKSSIFLSLLAVLLLITGCRQSKNIKLIVSNQSPDIPSVDISVSIDGRIVVNKDFPVKDQHHWEEFFTELSDGNHTIEIKANKGQVVLIDKFEVCNDKSPVIGVEFFYQKGAGYENGPSLQFYIKYKKHNK